MMKYILSAIGVLTLALCTSFALADKDYWVFLESINEDRYHGAGSVLVSGGEAIVMDVGRRIYAGKISAEIKSFPAKIKYIMISHAHEDHMGALSRVYRELPHPKPTVFFNYPQKRVCDAEPDTWGCDPKDIAYAFDGVPYQPLLEGTEIEFNNFHIKILAARYEGSLDENDESIIMWVTHKPSGNTMLTTGDANARVGRYVTEKYDLKTDVFFLPHHGCQGQPDDAMYYEADPHIAVWQTTVRALNERIDICGHTADMLKEMKTPIQLWQWHRPIERIDFPIEGIPHRRFPPVNVGAAMAPIISYILSE